MPKEKMMIMRKLYLMPGMNTPTTPNNNKNTNMPMAIYTGFFSFHNSSVAVTSALAHTLNTHFRRRSVLWGYIYRETTGNNNKEPNKTWQSQEIRHRYHTSP